MSFDIVKNFHDQEWLNTVAEKLRRKMTYAVQKAREVSYMPYTTVNGQWKENNIGWWTNGFWPAEMWQMYLATGEAIFRDEAIRTEQMLDEALANYETLSHDVGFMWLIHSGLRFALESNQESYDRTMRAAQHLACRYNPNGFIRAWNGAGKEGWAIVDCMMNLPLLYWASRQMNDPRFKLMAMRHADTTIEAFVRDDGSCNHIVIFDPTTGEMLDNPGGQGYASGSSWSRGQAWALYGFVLSYMCTGKQAYLDTAKRVAHYFIANIPEDGLVDCDFRQPASPELKDNAAGAIAASGLLELARCVPEAEGMSYFRAAIRMLRAMEETCINWEETDPALLTKCTSAYHDIPGRHMTMVYADYYFIEAINKLRGETRLSWIPDAAQAAVPQG